MLDGLSLDGGLMGCTGFYIRKDGFSGERNDLEELSRCTTFRDILGRYPRSERQTLGNIG